MTSTLRLKHFLSFILIVISITCFSNQLAAVPSSMVKGPDEITPVDLNYFNIKEVFNTAILYWSTLSEVEGNIFKIEKSADGKLYEELGRVEATKSRNYNFVDYLPFKNINYYRFTTIYPDGSTSISPVKVLIKEANSPFSVYPNFVKSTLTVQTRKDLFKETIVHVIYANTGEVVYQTALFAGNSQKDIDLSFLHTGNYVARVQYGSHIYHYFFSKE